MIYGANLIKKEKNLNVSCFCAVIRDKQSAFNNISEDYLLDTVFISKQQSNGVGINRSLVLQYLSLIGILNQRLVFPFRYYIQIPNNVALKIWICFLPDFSFLHGKNQVTNNWMPPVRSIDPDIQDPAPCCVAIQGTRKCR